MRGDVEVIFENHNRSREVSQALRYYHKTVCDIFPSGMRSCAMKGKSHVVTTWDSWEEAYEAARYLVTVQFLGCLITRVE
jgi:hypothetical protein